MPQKFPTLLRVQRSTFNPHPDFLDPSLTLKTPAALTGTDRITSMATPFYNVNARKPTAMTTTTTMATTMSRDNPRLPRDILISLEEGQNVQGEGGEAYIAQPSSYLAGIRNIAGAILGPGTGLAPSPRGGMEEELQRTKAELQQLDYEFLRAKGDNTTLRRTCFELDTENRKQKDTIQSLQRELTS